MNEPTLGQSVDKGYSLKPALVSIADACRYLGDISRAKLYADLLPHLDTVHIGSRHFVVVKSMDRLIATLKNAAADKPSRRDRLRKDQTAAVTASPDELISRARAVPIEHEIEPQQ
jgi:hypothetical protein